MKLVRDKIKDGMLKLKRNMSGCLTGRVGLALVNRIENEVMYNIDMQTTLISVATVLEVKRLIIG